MKLILVCSHGGHLSEMLALREAFRTHDTLYITYDNVRTRKLQGRKYLLKNIGFSPLRMMIESFRLAVILIRERPEVIISTGSEIAIPAIIFGKILRIHTIFIESWCRVSSDSGTGRIVYHFSDLFLVQWPQLLNVYGEKARFEGGIL